MINTENLFEISYSSSEFSCKSNFVLFNIEEFRLHDRWLSVLRVALIALSNVLHAADEVIRDQIVVDANSRILETYKEELEPKTL